MTGGLDTRLPRHRNVELPDRGQTVWDQAFGSRKAANFGTQGSGAESLLWRMQNGELDGYQAKVVVLHVIGVGDDAMTRFFRPDGSFNPEMWSNLGRRRRVSASPPSGSGLTRCSPGSLASGHDTRHLMCRAGGNRRARDMPSVGQAPPAQRAASELRAVEARVHDVLPVHDTAGSRFCGQPAHT